MTNPKAAPSSSNKKKGSNNPKKIQSKQNNTHQQQPNEERSKSKPKLLATLPPIESTNDYSELLESARSLTSQESHEELLECARYGETDAVRAILEIHSKISTSNAEDCLIDTADSTGNTALHKAAANGHETTVSLLLCLGAKHIPNENGATPLHWAAGAGKHVVCQILLDHFDALSEATASSEVKSLDVLLKNSFGRSALTEAFTSGNTETVGVLLNHDSAEEEKLIGGMKKEEIDDAGNVEGRGEQTRKKEEIVHEFDFNGGDDVIMDGGGRSVLIRELVRFF